MNDPPRLDAGLLLLRSVFGFRILFGTIDNLVSWKGMLEFADWLEGYGFPFPVVCAAVSVYFQFFAGLSWIAGFKVKIFSAFMIVNFLVAIFGVHINGMDPYLETAPAVHMLAVSIFLLLTGPGKYSIDDRLVRNRS